MEVPLRHLEQMSSSKNALSHPPVPVKATGSHFYRYSEFGGEKREWLNELVVRHRLYIPTIGQLNDPADGRPIVTPKSEADFFRFLWDSPFGVLGRNPTMPIAQQLHEYRVLRHNLGRLESENLQRKLVQILHDQMETGYRIYSLSKRYDNLSLWAKYAGNNTGYCLEFKNSANSLVSSAKEVLYGDAFPMDILNRDHQNGYWFFCKRAEWSNEEEVRVLVILGQGIHPPDGKYNIQPEWMSRIILGYRMPDADKELIRQWCSERKPKLRIAQSYFDPYEQKILLEGD